VGPIDRTSIGYLDNIQNCDNYVDVCLVLECLHFVGLGSVHILELNSV
jgi:hypothetical protein